MVTHIDTPCVGVCSTVYGDIFCRGCKRRSDEIITWNRYTALEKEKIYRRLSDQIEQVVEEFVCLFDETLLVQKLNKHGVRLPKHTGTLATVFHLLRAGHDKMHDTQKYGFSLLPHAQHLACTALFQQMDQRLYALCQTAAHEEGQV